MGWTLLLLAIPLVLFAAEAVFRPMLRRGGMPNPPSRPSEEGPYRDAPPLPEPPETPTYAEDWERYRLLRGLSSPILWLMAIPAGVITQHLLGGGDGGGVVAVIVIFAWIAVVVAARIRLQRFPCPRCKKPFHSTQTNEQGFCAHCNLRRYALLDPDAEAENRN